MRDHIDLGPAPSEEPCAQVGSPDYPDRARRECHAYVHQLRRIFGDEPDRARLSVKSSPHDFGTYWSVACYFDDHHPGSVDYAFRCERDGPTHWDEAARRGLTGATPSVSPAHERS